MKPLRPPRPARRNDPGPTDGTQVRESTDAAISRDDVEGDSRTRAPRPSATGRPVRHPLHRDATVFGVITVLVLEAVLVAVAAGSHHSRLIGALTAGVIGAFAVISALCIAYRPIGVPRIGHPGRARRDGHRHPPATVRREDTSDLDESWFTGDLTGFPTDMVRPLLEQDPVQGSLYIAWVLAVHGHTPAWLERHVDLPPGVADALVAAARRPSPAPPALTPREALADLDRDERFETGVERGRGTIRPAQGARGPRAHRG